MKHKYKEHEDCKLVHCPICDGGLSICEVCNGAEITLTYDCCGRRLTEDEEYQIACGLLNFKNGKWLGKNNPDEKEWKVLNEE
jgi:hypothetical protein